MDEFPRFGQELADAQAQLDEVLARCAIRLKAFDGVAAANDNALFPVGVRHQIIRQSQLSVLRVVR